METAMCRRQIFARRFRAWRSFAGARAHARSTLERTLIQWARVQALAALARWVDVVNAERRKERLVLSSLNRLRYRYTAIAFGHWYLEIVEKARQVRFASAITHFRHHTTLKAFGKWKEVRASRIRQYGFALVGAAKRHFRCYLERAALFRWARAVERRHGVRRLLTRRAQRWLFHLRRTRFQRWAAAAAAATALRQRLIARATKHWVNYVVVKSFRQWRRRVELRKMLRADAVALWTRTSLASALRRWDAFCNERRRLRAALTAAALWWLRQQMANAWRAWTDFVFVGAQGPAVQFDVVWAPCKCVARYAAEGGNRRTAKGALAAALEDREDADAKLEAGGDGSSSCISELLSSVDLSPSEEDTDGVGGGAGESDEGSPAASRSTASSMGRWRNGIVRRARRERLRRCLQQEGGDGSTASASTTSASLSSSRTPSPASPTDEQRAIQEVLRRSAASLLRPDSFECSPIEHLRRRFVDIKKLDERGPRRRIGAAATRWRGPRPSVHRAHISKEIDVGDDDGGGDEGDDADDENEELPSTFDHSSPHVLVAADPVATKKGGIELNHPTKQRFTTGARQDLYDTGTDRDTARFEDIMSLLDNVYRPEKLAEMEKAVPSGWPRPYLAGASSSTPSDSSRSTSSDSSSENESSCDSSSENDSSCDRSSSSSSSSSDSSSDISDSGSSSSSSDSSSDISDSGRGSSGSQAISDTRGA